MISQLQRAKFVGRRYPLFSVPLNITRISLCRSYSEKPTSPNSSQDGSYPQHAKNDTLNNDPGLNNRQDSSSDSPASDFYAEALSQPTTNTDFSYNNADSKKSFSHPKRHISQDDGNRATQHERAIFSKIFDSILESASTGSAKNAKLSNSTSKMSSSMQALFERAFATSPDESMPSNKYEDKPGSDVRMGFTTQDVRSTPLSMAPMIQQPSQGTLNTSQIFQIQAILKKKFSPIITHMNSLKTDHEVSEFYKSRVLSEFYNQMVQKKKTTSKKDPGHKTMAEREIEDIKSSNISVDNFPVNYHTLPILLKESMRILADDFNSPMEAITLFELTKSESVEVYVAGCNVSVYNEALRIKWNSFKDLYLIESLISEMQLNGVKGNTETSQILSHISESAKFLKTVALNEIDTLETASVTSLWSGEDEERMININMYRLKTVESLYDNDSVKKDELMTLLLD